MAKATTRPGVALCARCGQERYPPPGTVAPHTCLRCRAVLAGRNVEDPVPSPARLAARARFPIVYIACKRCQKRLVTIQVKSFARSLDEAIQKANEARADD